MPLSLFSFSALFLCTHKVVNLFRPDFLGISNEKK